MQLPEGWPTEEMLLKGFVAYQEIYHGVEPDGYDAIAAAFIAMLEAAPTPPGIKLRDGEFIDLANKAAPHNDRDNDLFYINMGRLVENVLNERFQAATPPAPKNPWKEAIAFECEAVNVPFNEESPDDTLMRLMNHYEYMEQESPQS